MIDRKRVTRTPIRRNIFASFLLGIVTTVVVAWSFAVFVRPEPQLGDFHTTSNTLTDFWSFELWCYQRHGATMYGFTIKHNWGADITTFNSAPYDPPDWVLRIINQRFQIESADYKKDSRHLPLPTFPSENHYLLRSAGWPAESMWCENNGFLMRGASLSGGIELPAFEPDMAVRLNRALPFYILPSGFAVDTACFFLLWSTLFVGLPFARKKWRIREGCCPACGYDQRGLPTNDSACPECGHTTASVKMS